jgi:hypothetical protein
MLNDVSIKDLYRLALAEGEGVGTAYEYYAKRLNLDRWLKEGKRPERILIAGLPEKYGASLDFFFLAHELGAGLVVVDDRPEAVARAQAAVAVAQSQGLMAGLETEFMIAADLAGLPAGPEGPDLVLSSETLQRLPAGLRLPFWQRLVSLSPAVAVFAPNADNPAHTNLSGLDGLHLDELRSLLANTEGQCTSGYIDLPPFPPGMIRSEEQRQRASSGRLEGLAMWGLGRYARLERWLPTALRRRFSHIVYAFCRHI